MKKIVYYEVPGYFWGTWVMARLNVNGLPFVVSDKSYNARDTKPSILDKVRRNKWVFSE